MKKLFIFLMTILSSTIVFATDVEAQSYTFYESEYIDGVYMTREKGAVKIYQKASIVRKKGDNKAAYCTQPFLMFDGNSAYNVSPTPEGLTAAQKDRIEKIAYYGYGYGTHTNPVWYAVTQLMIWQTVEPNGSYYFTQGLDGPAISTYNSHINEINAFIQMHDKVPSFNNSTVVLREGSSMTLYDGFGVINTFTPNSNMVSISGNQLTINAEKEGEYTINFTKKFNNGSTIYFFNHPTSQNLMTSGSLSPLNASIKVIVKKTRLDVTKIDKDTKSTTPSGEGVLYGAEYDILDKDYNVVGHIIIDENCTASIEDLDFGTFYLKETKAGTGYTLDEKLHEFTISEDNPTVSLELENEIIKKKVEIHKKYGDSNNSKPEAGIVFNIYDSNGNLVDSIITDENGYACIELPYGTYTVKQETSTEGYEKVEDFEINISDSEDDKLEFELLDYIIKVPNTKSNKQSNYLLLIMLISSGVIYVKKEIYL